MSDHNSTVIRTLQANIEPPLHESCSYPFMFPFRRLRLCASLAISLLSGRSRGPMPAIGSSSSSNAALVSRALRSFELAVLAMAEIGDDYSAAGRQPYDARKALSWLSAQLRLRCARRAKAKL